MTVGTNKVSPLEQKLKILIQPNKAKAGVVCIAYSAKNIYTYGDTGSEVYKDGLDVWSKFHQPKIYNRDITSWRYKEVGDHKFNAAQIAFRVSKRMALASAISRLSSSTDLRTVLSF